LPGLPKFFRNRLAWLEASPLGARLVSGAFWILLGTGLARGWSLLASMAVARLLGTEEFGQLGVIQSTVGVFSAFAGLGLGLTATKHVAEFRQSDPVQAGRILNLSFRVAVFSGLALAVVMAVLAGPLAQHTLGAPQLEGLLRISAIMILLGALNGAQTGALTGFEAFKSIALVNLRTGLASCVLLVLGVLLAGVIGAVWSLVATLGVNCLLNHYALRAETRRAGVPRTGIGVAEWRLLWTFSLPAMLCSVMIVPVNWVGVTFLIHQPDGYSEMGWFNAANQWRNAILFVPQALAGIALPALASLRLSNERQQYAKVFWSNVLLIGSVALGIALLVIAASGWIMQSYGAAFIPGRMTLILLALSAVVMAVNQVLGADMISHGRMWAGLFCNSVWAGSFLGLAWWLVPHHGARGLALAILGAYPIHSVCLLVLNSRWAGPKPVQPQPAGFTPIVLPEAAPGAIAEPVPSVAPPEQRSSGVTPPVNPSGDRDAAPPPSKPTSP
jgi:O-antigen/teichoic acid export membrane protein